MKYLLQYHDIKHLENNDEQLKQLINSTPGIKINDLKLEDLVFHKEEPIYRGVGVYIFKSPERVYYVGSCVSRNFVERIPGHFDIRKNGWFNSLLKAIAVKKLGLVVDNDSLTEAAKYSFKNLSLVLINFDSRPDDHINTRIFNLERKLGDILKPYNNRFPRHKEIHEISPTVEMTALPK